MNRMRAAQTTVLNSLLQTDRLARLAEQAALDGSAAYRPEQFLEQLRTGIWSELAAPARAISPYRRNAQRAYLDTIDNRLNGNAPPEPEVRAMLRGELRTLRARLVSAIPLAVDRASRVHLEDSRDQIDEMLDPRAMRQGRGTGRGGPAGPAVGSMGLAPWQFDFANDPFQRAPDGCWVDYVF